ncbi:MAG TPA: hypothetical protein VIL98_06110 [Gaiellaceae bacterium]
MRTADPWSLRSWRSDVWAAPRRFLARRGPLEAAPALADVHELLLAAASEEPTGPPRRLPFVALDGTPLVYSATTSGDAFRLLAEPGALDRDVPSQVDFALSTLDALVGILGWRGAAADVDTVVRAALPPTAEEARTLRGGVGLGLAADAKGIELRVYLDLRGGNPVARWQRVADALAPFGDRESEASFASLLVRAAPRAVPVGLAAVLADNALRGLRVYVGVDRHAVDDLAALTELPRSAIEPFAATLGPFGPQRVIAAFDFALEDSLLRTASPRTKIDACRLGVEAQKARAEIAALAGAYAVDAAPLQRLVADLDETFGESTIQYLGVGRRRDVTELAVYVEPAGLARR